MRADDGLVRLGGRKMPTNCPLEPARILRFEVMKRAEQIGVGTAQADHRVRKEGSPKLLVTVFGFLREQTNCGNYQQ